MNKSDYPTSEARGGSGEELPQPEVRGSVPECQAAMARVPGGHGAVRAERSYPASEVRGGGWEQQPHIQGAVAARAPEGLEELFHVQGREGRR